MDISTIVTMPEATVYENDYSFFSKNKIGVAEKRVVSLPTRYFVVPK
jgi:hypothetical protein